MNIAFRCNEVASDAIHAALEAMPSVKFNIFRFESIATTDRYVIQLTDANDIDRTFLLLTYGHLQVHEFSYNRENMTWMTTADFGEFTVDHKVCLSLIYSRDS